MGLADDAVDVIALAQFEAIVHSIVDSQGAPRAVRVGRGKLCKLCKLSQRGYIGFDS